MRLVSELDKWVIENYNTLVRNYGGKYVLLADKQVVFSDDSFEIVYERYYTLKKNKACKISLIDDGEAIL